MVEEEHACVCEYTGYADSSLKQPAYFVWFQDVQTTANQPYLGITIQNYVFRERERERERGQVDGSCDASAVAASAGAAARKRVY